MQTIPATWHCRRWPGKRLLPARHYILPVRQGPGELQVLHPKKENENKKIKQDMKKLILCDKDSAENNWNYKCPRLSSDDWDELADPCDGCSHKIFKYVEIDDHGQEI